MMSWFCLIEYMQQIFEQSGLPTVLSREPVHMTKPMRSGTLPSPGRSTVLYGRVGPEAVHLHAGDDVLEPSVAVLRLEIGGEQGEAGREDHCAHLGLEFLPPHVQVDAPPGRRRRTGGTRADTAVEASSGAVSCLFLVSGGSSSAKPSGAALARRPAPAGRRRS